MGKCIYARCKREVPEGARYCPFCGRKQGREQTGRPVRKKGTGSVYRLSGSRRQPYYAVLNGVSTGRTYATRREAEAALEGLLALRRPERYRWTLEECYHAWLELARRDLGASALRGYELAWSYVPEALRRRPGREVRAEDLQPVIDALQRRGLPFAVGVLPENDLDVPTARALAARVITDRANEPVSPGKVDEALAVLESCEALLCVTDFGTVNREEILGVVITVLRRNNL